MSSSCTCTPVCQLGKLIIAVIQPEEGVVKELGLRLELLHALWGDSCTHQADARCDGQSSDCAGLPPALPVPWLFGLAAPASQRCTAAPALLPARLLSSTAHEQRSEPPLTPQGASTAGCGRGTPCHTSAAGSAGVPCCLGLHGA